ERRLEPNTRLVESQLSVALSTSRANARQALLLLAQRKLVKIVPNKGAVVAEPSKTEAVEVFAARRCIEREIIHLVCERCQAEDVQVLRIHLEKEQQARVDRDHFELIRATGKFHLLLAEIAGNQVLLDFLQQLIARSSLILEKFESHGSQTCQEGDHAELVRLIAEGTEEKAQQLMDRHLMAIEQILNFKRKIKPKDLTEVFAPFLESQRGKGS
ncbi:MAG: GntR family transcriptional regulator, partial [Desulfofustis sp.]|nr:GntR family transcriptional regulator [Desulfofustis sp.]